MKYCCLLVLFIAQYVFGCSLYAQEDNILEYPDKAIVAIQKKYVGVDQSMNKQLSKMLSKLQKGETKFQKHLSTKDTSPQQLLASSGQQYQYLQQKLQYSETISKKAGTYIPKLDTLQTATKFLSQNNTLNNKQQDAVKRLGEELGQLNNRFSSAEEIQFLLQQRKEQLTQLLKSRGGDIQKARRILNTWKKHAYYYQAQVSEYKELLEDQQKLEEKTLATLRELPAFQSFMQKNSCLAQLFPESNSSNTTDPATVFAGLQTKANVEALLQQRFGSISSSSSGAGNYMQQQIQQGQDQLNALKNKATNAIGGNDQIDMPDFKPNTQKTKTFWKRLEPNINIQSQRKNGLLPSISDIGLSLGYKLNDKSIAGIGASYKLGWGQPLKHIRFTSEGVGLRSFLDIKIKGNWWISGGGELNYMQSFKSLHEIHNNVNVWQRSALLGISRKMKLGKQTSNVQLLYDFLWRQQVPNAQQLKFRVGMTMNN